LSFNELQQICFSSLMSFNPEKVCSMKLNNGFHPLRLICGRKTSEGRNNGTPNSFRSELGATQLGILAKVDVWFGLIADRTITQHLVAILTRKKYELNFWMAKMLHIFGANVSSGIKSQTFWVNYWSEFYVLLFSEINLET